MQYDCCNKSYSVSSLSLFWEILYLRNMCLKKFMRFFTKELLVKIKNEISPLGTMHWIVQVQAANIIAQWNFVSSPSTFGFIPGDCGQFQWELADIQLDRRWGNWVVAANRAQVKTISFPVLLQKVDFDIIIIWEFPHLARWSSQLQKIHPNRSGLTHWYGLKRSGCPPSRKMPPTVRSMLRLKHLLMHSKPSPGSRVSCGQTGDKPFPANLRRVWDSEHGASAPHPIQPAGSWRLLLALLDLWATGPSLELRSMPWGKLQTIPKHVGIMPVVQFTVYMLTESLPVEPGFHP